MPNEPPPKPLVILPPAPARWPSVHAALEHKGPPWLVDLEQRYAAGVKDSRDAFAIVVDGGNVSAHAAISANTEVGVLGHVYTLPAFRKRGLAAACMRALLDWFDMTGGRWLYLTCHEELAALYERFGFQKLHRGPREGQIDVTMQRRTGDAGITPLPLRGDQLTIRALTRADWPLLVSLLQDHPGPDPTVSLDESAVQAEPWTLELLNRQDAGAVQVLGAVQSGRVVAFGVLDRFAAGETATVSFAPHNDVPKDLRGAIESRAREQGAAGCRRLFVDDAPDSAPETPSTA